MARNVTFGIIAFIAVWIVGGELLSRFPVGLSPAMHATTATFIASVAGAWIAKKNFMVVAAALWLLYWAVVLYIVHQISVPAGQVSASALISNNAGMIAASFSALFVGVFTGYALGRAKRPPTSAA